MKLTLAPIAYHWPRETVFSFYRAAAAAPFDTIYLGETVCTRRRELVLDDWLDIARALTAAGKRVVLSTPALPGSDADLDLVRRIAASFEFELEANDMAAVRLARGRTFVAGAALNVYNTETLAFMRELGARTWVAPVELSGAQLAHMQRQRPAGIETEVFVYGRMPLAHSQRCFTAQRFNLRTEACGSRCLDFPEGLPARTRELRPFLTLNGLQMQSAAALNLARELPAIACLGVDAVRMAAPYANVVEIAELLRRATEGPREAEASARELERLNPAPMCDGYWHGVAGMERVHGALAADLA